MCKEHCSTQEMKQEVIVKLCTIQLDRYYMFLMMELIKKEDITEHMKRNNWFIKNNKFGFISDHSMSSTTATTDKYNVLML